MKLVAATSNKHKLGEFRRILQPLGIEVISALEAVGHSLEIEETGSTFMENSAQKAEAIYKATGLPTFADDSGLCIDAMGGAPGIYSARYGGENTPHSEKIKLILKELDGVADEKRTARFVAAIYCVLNDEHAISCEGSVEGKIGYEPKGKDGFGYDPIFMVGERSFAEHSDAEKDAISHRGIALREFCAKLEKALQDKKT